MNTNREIHTKITKKDLETICKLYHSGKTQKEIGKKFNLTQGSIRYYLLKQGIQLRPKYITNRYYSLDHDFFEKIDTTEKAYWLGFLMADGTLYKETVILELAAKDKNHLLKFNKSLQSNKNIEYRKETNAFKLRISSKKLSSDLYKLGVVYRKSGIEIFPQMQNKFKLSFIRGILEADGWISLYQRKNKTKYELSIGMCGGSLKLLEDIKEYLCFFLKKNCGSLRPRKDSRYYRKPFYQLLFDNKNAIKILDLLYYNAKITLDRKYNKYIETKNKTKTDVVAY